MKRARVTVAERLARHAIAESELGAVAERWAEARAGNRVTRELDEELTEAQNAARRTARRLADTLKPARRLGA